MAAPRPIIPPSYEASRSAFCAGLARVQARWPKARLQSHPIGPPEEDLTFDWIEAEALERRDRFLGLSAGEHGVEGYVGSAVTQLFLQEVLPALEPRDTTLLLIHAINPWGMKHRRRTNMHNVDLNRNFLAAAESFVAPFNDDYVRLAPLLNPEYPIRNLTATLTRFWVRLLITSARLGPKRLQGSMLIGQYRFQEGLYYGGRAHQAETARVMKLFRQALQDHRRVLHLDIHTGYGPRDEMTIVNSCLEERASAERGQDLGYPRVVKATADEFYSIRGDMIDYLYDLRKSEFPDRRLYAAAFEFGTYGESTLATIRALRAMVLENQLFRLGASTAKSREWVLREFRELYLPGAPEWLEKALADTRRALWGILGAEGYITARPAAA
jgi:predicted deacylase